MNLKRKKKAGVVGATSIIDSVSLSFFMLHASSAVTEWNLCVALHSDQLCDVIAGVYPESSASEQPARTVVAGKSIQMAISASGGCRRRVHTT